ncbi:MAG: amidophosphoribosyltransferase [Candidatus Thalassarchaeaceae archaeon]|jgi:amidophosphoribosyltransferase|nr:amidophosphoribosyltransferase [Candidatus Thalassarchaeaceae archaeon]MDP6703540.1 amidophosphoribosyltransferase [Candidatus Thalassarchaeaceae archaeon]MDP7004481.1 amidophosphoribosyltransferase [Candidatus Thalassarchaeaceae archaeon]
MCGIIGIVGNPGSQVATNLYDALLVLQHRGQDAAGIVTSDSDNICHRRANGLVRDVFRDRHMGKLIGSMGIGHVRYPTAGSSSSAEAQPFYTNTPFGVSLAHNGNLNNTADIISGLLEYDHRRINTSSDSEALLNLFAAEVQRSVNGRPGGMGALSEDDIFRAIERTHLRAEGSYSVVCLVTGWGLVAFRDPNGIRPLFMGRNDTEGFTERLIASESVACKALGFEPERDIAPGEAVIIRMDGSFHSKPCHPNPVHTPCVFEYVYFARPDSVIDGISVHAARLRMGEALAKRIIKMIPDHEIEAVVPVPDSGRIAAIGLASELGVPYREGFVKNRYIGRTFIMPGQRIRKDSVRKKLNTIDEEFQGKTILIVDDSIVRGNTSRRIVQMAREAGAAKVLFASSSPPIVHPNVYGIDMPARSEYVAYGKDAKEICEAIGADWLIYQELGALVEACLGSADTDLANLDCSCFDGVYVTGGITEDYLLMIEGTRGDSSKGKASV